jgi:hypothetical protein
MALSAGIGGQLKKIGHAPVRPVQYVPRRTAGGTPI